ncbi:protein-tyrosine phosphatase family protein [Lyngbya confervoides]|uniref:Dual specificity protein phosphatase family protein n=1 Tax=Lyngbya confervoides BDU141951 TaxID=1574623 RepID=A0ABD4T1P3_9CYAN|nr:dual specificity protein phosphatase family protein [Lyngbya confervoides]MCM1982499.1 dual specificity protein phosphatase family protein [Lyngbya confervoides BDU141951]
MSKRFSWIVPEQLAVGSFPEDTSAVYKLRKEGITAVLTLTEEHEILVPDELRHNFVWERVPIPDGYTGGIPSVEQFAQAMGILNRWSQKMHSIYVHCLAGVGRSPSVCCLFMVSNQGMSLEDAIAHVKLQHSYAAPDEHQVRVMRELLLTSR